MLTHLKAQQFLTGSVNRRIFGATLTVAGVALLIKLAALGKEMIVAWRYGTSGDLDAFNVALILPFAFINVAATSFQTAFIPVYVQVQQREGNNAAQQLLSGAAFVLIGIFLLATLILIVVGKIVLPLVAGGFATEKISLAFQLLCLIAPIILLNGTTALWGAVLNAEQSFAIVAATPIATTIITIICLVSVSTGGIYLLAGAMTLGALIELLILGKVLTERGIYWQPQWPSPVVATHLKKIVPHSFVLLAGNLMMSGMAIISVMMAARLASGSVAALGYANKLIALPAGFTASALGVALVPYFSRMRANEEWGQIRQTLKRYLQLAFLLTTPLTLLLLLLAQPLTKILFQRGAFESAAVEAVSTLLFYFALQLPFYVSGVLVARLLLALECHREIFLISVANLVLNVSLNYFLMPRMGIAGIALATSLTYFFSFVLLSVVAHQKLNI